MLTVRFVDHSDELKELLQKKVAAAIAAGAQSLAKTYRDALSVPAPPHSSAGEMPHAYNGHKEGGYGPVYERNSPNNRPPLFSSTQTRFLKDYIDYSDSGAVGFLPSHVTSRRQNYLIKWDTGQFFSATKSFARRPWIKRAYREGLAGIRSMARLAFEGVK